ncbi:MAG: hypothetical protein KKE86_13815 [Planctomycetes bacterium]|nr:hypothetical protein [Planctomycetota bacterium]MBU4400397.1 hypothetical protein [Planctomycetota bacterium]MCG2685047.1 hypothetical protein [Planctomycetales bacterium]
MRTKRFVAILVVFGTLGIIAAAPVQRSAGEEKSFFDRLDDFGRSIFDGILPSRKSKAENHEKAAPEKRRSDRWQDLSDPRDEAGEPRAGSVLEVTGRRSSEDGKPAGTKAEYAPKTMPPIYRRGEDGTPKPVRRPLAGTSLLDDEEARETPTRQTPARPPRKATRDESDIFGDLPDLSDLGKPVLKPLHKRLADFGQSVFGSDKEQARRPQPNFQPERTSESAPIEATVDTVPETPRATGRPVIAQRATPGLRPMESLPVGPLPDVVDDAPTAAGETPSTAEKAPAAKTIDKQSGVLFARKGPNLSVETFGPRTISVGRESTYEVHVINSGNVAAEGLVVYVSLPEWAEVAGAEASAGDAGATDVNRQDGTVPWKVGYLNAKERERLTLKIIPRQSRPFDLEVRWNYKPTASQASIEVQEPKLVMQLEGPREVFYGKKELFQLRLANTGTGDAENVVLALMPVGAGENVQATHKVGLLKAGGKKTLEVELTARQAGNLTVQVEVRADGNLHAELAEKVLVRRAGLKIDLDGPKVQFVGTVANYAVTVVNPGNAPARNVKFSLALPSGAKYLSGIEGARINSSGEKLVWTLDSLGAQEERHFAIKCRLAAAGLSRMRLNANADDDLTARAETVVRVEAVADLTMDVKDPTGPVPVGEEVIYEVRVRNRGTKEARGVEVFAYFSRGIEPIAAEGAANRLGPGRVVFQPIESLAPDAEVVLKVRARAETAGNHVFRAETHCEPLGARLISEATNLYYGDAPAAKQTAREPSDETPTR